MKKYLFILCCFFLIGCGKNNEKDVIKNIKKITDNVDTYTIEGELNMYNGDDTYTYSVSVNHKKDDFYRVSLVNKVNNHEQIILRNNDGVYVLTPSLNKSFKFQSDWPYNNSQVYILERLISDIENDGEKVYEFKDNNHIFKTKVNYSTNNDLVTQKVYFDENYKLSKVEVYNVGETVAMDFKVSKFEENSRIDDNIFNLDSNIENDSGEEKAVSKTIDDVVYPMYLPDNTYLTSQDRVNKDDGERVILTFGGDKSFTIIEETIAVSKELETNLTYGEPSLVIDTVGSITDYSINWMSNGIEYSLLSENLDQSEMLSVAKSISSSSITK